MDKPTTWRRWLLPSLVFALVYALFFVYPPLRLGFTLNPSWQPGTLALLVIMTGPALARLSYERFPNGFTRWCSAIGFTWAGICFIGLLLLLPFEIVDQLGFDALNQTTARYLLGAIAALGFLGLVNAQQTDVCEVSIAVPDDAPPSAKGLQFAQISDVHIGSRSPAFLKRVVRKTNALKVDRVFITGDLIDFAHIQQQQLEPLAELEAPVDFCIGNHERYVDLEAICDRLTALGINVLRNRSENVNINTAPVQIIGIDDADRRDQVGLEIAKLNPQPEHYRILLYHRPDDAEAAATWGAHLMLCGHTHNGQIVPFNFLVRRVFPRISGSYPIEQMTLYVSTGTGTWGPVLRLGSRGEITHLRLV